MLLYILDIVDVYLFILFKLIFIGIELLYNVVFVSAVQQSESAVQFSCSVLSDSVTPWTAAR